MENEITLNDLIACFKRNWWKILAIALAAVLLAGLFTHFFIAKKYTSTIEFYIINTNESSDYVQTGILGASEQLANDYVDIIRGDRVLGAVSEDLKAEKGINLSVKKLRSRIGATTDETSSLFTISVVDTDPQRAYDIANSITKIAPDLITEITKPGERTASVPVTTSLEAIAKTLKEIDETKYGATADAMNTAASELRDDNSAATLKAILDYKDAVEINRYPEVATKESSPNMLLVCALAAAIAAVISYVVFVILSLLNTTIISDEDVRKAFSKYPLIAIIPSWDTSSKSNYAKTNYHRK